MIPRRSCCIRGDSFPPSVAKALVAEALLVFLAVVDLTQMELDEALAEGISLVAHRLHIFSLADEALRLRLEGPVLHIMEDDVLRDDAPKDAVVGDRQRQILLQKHVVDEPFREVVPRPRHKEAAAALAQVHLKELVLPVARVVFHVEVREADVADLLEEVLHLLGERVVPRADDGGVAANPFGGVLLEQRVAERDELDLPVAPAVAVHHAHPAVVAGNEFLQDEVILVRRAVDRVENRVELLAVLRDENLLLVRKAAVPVGHGVARLDDDREAERQLDPLVILKRARCRLREREAVLLAHLIEALLDAQPHEQRLVDALEAVRAAQLVLVADKQLDVIVPARDEQKRFAGIALRKPEQGVDEDLVVLEVRLHGLDGDNPAVRGRAEHSLSHGHALDAVRFVEGVGHAVYIHIAAEQHRKKIRNRRRMQNETPPHVIVGRRFRRRLSDYYTLRARKIQHGFPAKRRFSHFCQNLKLFVEFDHLQW